MSRKIFVGSLPNGIDETTLRTEFDQYGQIEDVFVKQGCEAGRQWAFITFADSAQAQHAKDLCDRILHLPGAEKPCDVMLAKNQGMGGAALPVPGPPGAASYAPHANSALAPTGPRKIFVGSLPSDITDAQLRDEFNKYGSVEDTYIKQGCEPGRQWAFVTFSSHAEASLAKQSTDNILTFPGSPKSCEVTLAKNQGMFGQDSAGAPGAAAPMAGLATPMSTAPRKIFVGSLPDSITDVALRAEFGKYGAITDLFLKTGCEPGRQWAFITFQTPDQANYAKNSADRTLVLPGAEKAVEVMLARNQGKGGSEPLAPAVGAVMPVMAASPYAVYAQPHMVMAPAFPGAQPPPPMAPPPAHLTPWRTYYTAAGLPYYHNATSGVTQWECPPDLQVPGQQQFHAAPAAPHYAAVPQYVQYQPQPVRYAPY